MLAGDQSFPDQDVILVDHLDPHLTLFKLPLIARDDHPPLVARMVARVRGDCGLLPFCKRIYLAVQQNRV